MTVMRSLENSISRTNKRGQPHAKGVVKFANSLVSLVLQNILMAWTIKDALIP